MPTFVEVPLYAFVSLLLPLIVYSLVTGSQPPEKSWFGKYYRAEKYLNFAGNVFMLTVCSTAIVRLADRFGYVDAGTKSTLDVAIGVPFGLTLLVFLALWIRAALKVRRMDKSSVAS